MITMVSSQKGNTVYLGVKMVPYSGKEIVLSKIRFETMRLVSAGLRGIRVYS